MIEDINGKLKAMNNEIVAVSGHEEEKVKILT